MTVKKLATTLERRASQLRKGLVGDVRILAVMLDRAAAELRAAAALRKVG